ncbi:protein EFR3 homolog B-like [Girardinichthys multiradiatus]|uniref:protein EFR3 homolog B-like n=1 Tax=Girardinichthys multiradiatus TaxID=208333 RepID=UPI001FAE5C69|nr:protein EFR3 homolog B-like [Girardinichthys multiradiatus]
MSPVLILRNLRLIIFETLENTIEDRGPVEEEERRKRMQVVERFQTAPSEEIAALCGSRLRHLLKLTWSNSVWFLRPHCFSPN